MDSGRVQVGGISFDPVTRGEVSKIVSNGWAQGRGGTIVTPNIDIWCRTRTDLEARQLVAGASLVVADGQPLVWAARLAGSPLPERVSGSGLVESLCAQAARENRSAYLIGGGTGDAANRAGAALALRHRGLRLAGTAKPPFGFEEDERAVSELVESVAHSAPDLVLIGLGFPKQEWLADKLTRRIPSAWLLGCGAGIAMAAGDTKRPPEWAQSAGLEWLIRFGQEPRRLWRRYLRDDVPAALVLLGGSARSRLRRAALTTSRQAVGLDVLVRDPRATQEID